MRKNFLFITLFISSLSYGEETNSTLWCKGKITNSYVSSSSGLFVKPSWGGWKQLCNLDGNFNSISTETCNSWLSMAQISIAADKDIIIKLEDVSGQCSNQEDNSGFPKPTYVQLVK